MLVAPDYWKLNPGQIVGDPAGKHTILEERPREVI